MLSRMEMCWTKCVPVEDTVQSFSLLWTAFNAVAHRLEMLFTVVYGKVAQVASELTTDAPQGSF